MKDGILCPIWIFQIYFHLLGPYLDLSNPHFPFGAKCSYIWWQINHAHSPVILLRIFKSISPFGGKFGSFKFNSLIHRQIRASKRLIFHLTHIFTFTKPSSLFPAKYKSFQVIASTFCHILVFQSHFLYFLLHLRFLESRPVFGAKLGFWNLNLPFGSYFALTKLRSPFSPKCKSFHHHLPHFAIFAFYRTTCFIRCQFGFCHPFDGKFILAFHLGLSKRCFPFSLMSSLSGSVNNMSWILGLEPTFSIWR